ncbi:MAG: prepilin-type N-terminal cleavage/methylation domain-containing protein [Ectothiorhodospiraceae bacterium]|nr:prepilin-type N-terminal cleavage/methylation domain-containing protein [Chromatiales bacterium]MCP5155046.1 prepilin-type N-terminal cleavage/methylation domain-containing protein [Ectothiorhodospiraceae bacterium]
METVRTGVIGPGRGRAGFTLVELVMVIAIVGVVAAVAGRFVTQPVAGFLDVTRRARLVDAADVALTRLGREARIAAPNSLRIGAGGRAVEFLRLRTGGRYRAEPPGSVLSFTSASGSFEFLGELPDLASIRATPGAGVAQCAANTVDCVLLYNTGQAGADAWALDNLAAVQAASAAGITFARSTPFPLASPGQRFFVVEGPVAYLCDLGAGTLRRYSGHTINASQGAVDTHAELLAAGAASALVADGVSACRFDYRAGTATRGGLLTIALTIAEAGEQVSLLHQVHVRNVP